jgi:hypothetical protein
VRELRGNGKIIILGSQTILAQFQCKSEKKKKKKRKDPGSFLQHSSVRMYSKYDTHKSHNLKQQEINKKQPLPNTNFGFSMI